MKGKNSPLNSLRLLLGQLLEQFRSLLDYIDTAGRPDLVM